MPTYTQTARVWCRMENIWFQNWERIAKTSNIDLVQHLKKLMVYYPKSTKALKFLALRLQGVPNEPGYAVNEEILRLAKALLAKYNKSFIRQIEISDSRSFPLLEKVNLASATAIKLVEPEEKNYQRNLLNTVKSLHSLELDVSQAQEASSDHLKKYLYRIKSINSLTLTNLAYLPLEDYKRLFRHLKNNLKCLTITGGIWNEFNAKPEEYLAILEFFLNLPKLQVFRFDASLPFRVKIDDLPLDILKQRGIKFDIRTMNQGTSSVISSKNSQALSDIEVLGINTQFRFKQPCTNWDEIEKAHLKIQDNTKGNLFYLNRMMMDPTTPPPLSNILNTCRNISTLNLILSSETQNLDFSGLSQLSNLQNIFVQFYECQKPPGTFWKSLETLAQNHKKLQFASFDFYDGQVNDADYSSIILPFFEASQDILQKVIVKFRLTLANSSGVKYFYQGLKKLKRVSSLSLLIDDPLKFPCMGAEHCNCHYDHLKDLFENLNNSTLTELNLLLPDVHDPNLTIIPSKALKKLSLEAFGRKEELPLINNFQVFEGLKQLDLNFLQIQQETWKDLEKKIQKFGQVEILRLRLQNYGYEIPIENFESLMKEKKNIKYLLVEKYDLFGAKDCFVLKRRDYNLDVDVGSFLTNGAQGMPAQIFIKKKLFL